MRATVGASPTPQQEAESFAADGGQIDLRAVAGVLRRHQWLIVGTIAAILAVTLLVTSQLRQQFTANTLVVVDSRDSQMLGFEPGIAEGMGLNNQIDTEVEIARSAKVGERAAIALGIAAWPDFSERASFRDMLQSMFGMAPPRAAPGAKPAPFEELSETEQARLVAALQNRLQIRRVGLTSVISISATAYEAITAAKVANALADAYLTEQIVAKVGSNERTAAFLRARVESLAGDISSLENQIDAFVTNALGQLGSVEAKELLTRLSEEGKQREANSSTLSQIQDALKANDYTRLASLSGAQQADLAARRQALVDQLRGINDPIRQAEAQKNLETLNNEIKAAVDRRTAALQADLSASQTRTAQTRQQIDNSLNQLQLPKDVSVELFRMQRDAETRRTLYDSFLTKLRAVEQQTDFNIPDSRVIAAAAPPNEPSFPPFKLILAGSILFSLGAGIGLAFLREHFIGGITSVEQFENLTNLQVVAAVPRHVGGDTPDRPDLAIVHEPLSAFSESIRRIRIGLDAYAPKGKRCVFITSPLPADGKTTIAMSLTRHLAMTGISTLLIDADLRHPSVHRLLGEKVEKGLIDFLAQSSLHGVDELTMVTEAATGAQYVLGSEASSIATDALLMSSRFEELMAFAREKYDVVIVDTPPVGLVVDATIVARHCDVGLFVVKYAATGQQAVRASIRDLTRRVDLPICGVLNQVEKSDSYRYGYGRDYQRYYR